MYKVVALASSFLCALHRIMATRAVTLVALLAIGAQLAYLHFQGAHPSSIEGAADDDDNPPPITCERSRHHRRR